MADESPFVPGVEVAVLLSGYGERSIRRGVVATVHKTGRFTLEGDTQQYRPYPPSWNTDKWSASATGPGWHNERVEILTPAHLTKIVKAEKAAAQLPRLEAARAALNKCSLLADADLLTIERILGIGGDA